MKSGLPAWRPLARACTSWVLALMLLVSLLPAVSRAMGAMDAQAGAPAGATRAGWVEICGAGGIRWVQLDPSATDAGADEAPGEPAAPPLLGHLGDLNHCALCGLAVDRCLPPDAVVAWTAPETSTIQFFPARPLPVLAWPHARPRATGPPLRS
jgi:hypothetical protein